MQAEFFTRQLCKHGITACYGVPDSLLKSFCAYVTDEFPPERHTITANEGNAVGMACGHYLATGRPALVYMQNSGLGNCVNPLLSLMDEAVYSIPVLLLIGWRGEPSTKDEPQHAAQGRLTLPLLETMGIEYAVLSDAANTAAEQTARAAAYMSLHKKPYALVARKGVFDSYTLKNKRTSTATLSREQAVCAVASALDAGDTVISTTGQISRELYELRTRSGASHQSDFLTVGGMGHASSIALGVAQNRPERRVICLDGDGAFLMHMGAVPIIGNSGLSNFRHIIFNNAAHDSVGGQATIANHLDFRKIARASGYRSFLKVDSEAELAAAMPDFLSTPGPAMLEITVRTGARPDLGRPAEKPTENKKIFMQFMEEGQAHVHPGSFQLLPELIQNNKWQKILLFSTERRLAERREEISAISAMCELCTYTRISPNPTAEDVLQALRQIQGSFDAILALGGGSCIDFAKLYRAATDNGTDIRTFFQSPFPLVRNTPLVAVPTTAGTGSEATRFAVVYLDGEKYSLDDAAVMPDYALVDSELMAAAPQYLKASCGMDAFAQAIEGYWANGASAESDSYAMEAITLCRDYLTGFVSSDSAECAAAMAKASYLAGKSISIARTTAAHALSYKITQRHGVPHGHAVALSLPGLAELHALRAEENSPLQQKMQWICSTLGCRPQELRGWFYKLYEDIRLPYLPAELGIESVASIVSGVNTERLSNNPLPLTAEQMIAVFPAEA